MNANSTAAPPRRSVTNLAPLRRRRLSEVAKANVQRHLLIRFIPEYGSRDQQSVIVAQSGQIESQRCCKNRQYIEDLNQDDIVRTAKTITKGGTLKIFALDRVEHRHARESRKSLDVRIEIGAIDQSASIVAYILLKLRCGQILGLRLPGHDEA